MPPYAVSITSAASYIGLQRTTIGNHGGADLCNI